MPKRSTHPAAIRVYPNVDHVRPRALKGLNTDENLIAACTPCNEWLGAREERPDVLRPPRDWDGLVTTYGPLVCVFESRIEFHKHWLSALGQ